MVMVTPDFFFIGFEPDELLRKMATRSLNRLLELAPYGATSDARLEKVRDGYCCWIDLYTVQGPFRGLAYQSSAATALIQVCETIQTKIDLWKKTRNLNTDSPQTIYSAA